jgi:hypothetical protein
LPSTSPPPLCRLERLANTLYFGSRGSPSPSASPPTSAREARPHLQHCLRLRLERLAITFGIASDSAREARRHLWQRQRLCHTFSFALDFVVAAMSAQRLVETFSFSLDLPSPLHRLKGFAGDLRHGRQLRRLRYSSSRLRPSPQPSPQSSIWLQGLVLTFDFIVMTFDISINLASIANSAQELAGSPSTSMARVLNNSITFDRYFNLYIIYVDYFNYMRSLSHEHQPRGAGCIGGPVHLERWSLVQRS